MIGLDHDQRTAATAGAGARTRTARCRAAGATRAPETTLTRHVALASLASVSTPLRASCATYSSDTASSSGCRWLLMPRYEPLDLLCVPPLVYVICFQTSRSRGFAFVYFVNTDDAKVAKEQCNGLKINSKSIRVDYSITQRAHTPTPGIYMGKPTS